MVEAAPDCALYPLTAFDRVFERSIFVTGWLVQGTIDADLFASALGRVTEKWRMLAARVESVKTGHKTSYRLRIPLGPLPPDYKTFALTTTQSDIRLSSVVPLPLPLHAPSLPHSLFNHPTFPRTYVQWETTKHPITCWHLTYCAPEPDGVTHTCIGFNRSHGIFDGVGAAAIMRAIVAELDGKPWDVPPLPEPGLNENDVLKLLEPEVRSREIRRKDYVDHTGFTNLGIGGAISLAGWHLRERYWRGADRRLFILPWRGLEHMVDGVRTGLKQEGCDLPVSTGDVMVAWLLKIIYAAGTPPQTIVHCVNIASFRPILGTKEHSLTNYPHNAWVPLPYPIMSVQDINSLSLADLSRRLTMFRLELSIHHVVAGFDTITKYPLAAPGHPDTEETFLVSNVSASRILETDWSKLGGQKTLCGYRYSLSPTEILLANSAYISGRLADGSVVLDVTLSKARLALLVKEAERLVAISEKLEMLTEVA